MKATGIVRKIDELGRIVIPKELRRTMGLAEKDPIEIFTEDGRIVLKKYEPLIESCVFCGESHELQFYRGKMICKDCLEKIAKQVVVA